MTHEKPYRFMVTLSPAHRRKLALLQVTSIDAAGKMATTADIVRALIDAAPVRGGKST